MLRFRVIAYLVGVGLITLVLVGVPLKYLADAPALAETVSPVHGLLFMIYLALTADLSSRCRLGTVPTLWVMLAGTIPFLSFVAERRVTRTVLERQRSTHGT
ncbi:membrane protein [Protofrankia coriariae]|uniref:Membrane protein n=1 Tax=Protofrankia coriariae TaxID=1562887 RepID=A0ABR5F2H0_9ACTN|nr:membrane protein [Protofrankia coriariae]